MKLKKQTSKSTCLYSLEEHEDLGRPRSKLHVYFINILTS